MRKDQGITRDKLDDIVLAIKCKSIAFAEYVSKDWFYYRKGDYYTPKNATEKYEECTRERLWEKFSNSEPARTTTKEQSIIANVSVPVCAHKNVTGSDGLCECLDCGIRNY